MVKARPRIPPTEPPLGPGGDFTVSWKEYFAAVADDPPTITAGVTDGSEPPAGDVGEYRYSNATSVAMGSGAFNDVIGISLPAGDWLAWGWIQFRPAGTTQVQALIAGLSTVSGAINGEYQQFTLPFTVGAGQRIATPMQRINTYTAGALYAVARPTFTVSTMVADGYVQARRMR